MPQLVLLSPATLVGLTLLTLPLAAHLVSRRTRRALTFPSTLLLTASLGTSTAWHRLRDWVILALRCAIVILLVLGASRLSLMTTDDAGTESTPRATVLMIDDHLSTRLLSDGKTAFQALQTLADDALAGHSQGQPTAVVWSSQRDDAPQWSNDLATLRQRIASHAPTYTEANMPASWAAARRLLRQSQGPGELIVITDRTADAWRFVSELRSQHDLPAGTRMTLLSPSLPIVNNIALSDANITPQGGIPTQQCNATVTVTNESNDVRTVAVRFEPLNAHPAVRTVTLAAGSATTVTFDFTPRDNAAGTARFSIDADDFEPDNQAWATYEANHEQRVLVAHNPGRAPTARRLQLAAKAKNEDADLSPARTIDALADADLSTVDHLLLVLDTPLPPDAATRLHQFVLNGGQLILWPTGDHVIDSARWPADWPRAGDDVSSERRHIAAVDGHHSLTRIFTGASEAALQHVWFDRTRSLLFRDDAAVPLMYADGVAALVAQSIGAGRIIVVGFDIDASTSPLVSTGTFVALVQQMLATHARHAETRQSEVGKPLVMRVPLATQSGTLTTPGRTSADNVLLTQAASSLRVTLPDPAHPGIYEWQHNDRTVTTGAVNVPASATRFIRLPADALAMELRQHSVGDSASGQPAQRNYTSLAGLCFILALLCMLGEIGISTKRDG